MHISNRKENNREEETPFNTKVKRAEERAKGKTEDKTEGDPARKRTTCTVMVFKKRKFTKRRPKN
jgi:hypothetical protein